LDGVLTGAVTGVLLVVTGAKDTGALDGADTGVLTGEILVTTGAKAGAKVELSSMQVS